MRTTEGQLVAHVPLDTLAVLTRTRVLEALEGVARAIEAPEPR
jgi:hypothetical protein